MSDRSLGMIFFLIFLVLIVALMAEYSLEFWLSHHKGYFVETPFWIFPIFVMLYVWIFPLKTAQVISSTIFFITCVTFIISQTGLVVSPT